MEIHNLNVSVLIISLRREREVKNIIKDLQKQDYKTFEVYIVCQDFKHKLNIKDKRFHITYIRKQQFTKLLNKTIKGIKTDVIIRVDDDVKITSKEFIKNHMKNYKDNLIAAVAGQVLNIKQTPNNTHTLTGRFSKFLRIPLTEGYNSTKRQNVDLFQGANYSFRKNIYTEVGGFNEKIIGNNYFEETDFAIKIRLTRGKVVFDPMCSLIHLQVNYGGAREKDMSKWFYFFGYNYAQLLKENFGFKSTYLGYIYIILSMLFGSIKYKKVYLQNGIQGYMDGIKNKPRYEG